MEATLWKEVLNYGGPVAVLTVLFYLFSKGYIVSKATLNENNIAFKNTIDQTIDAHKSTIERIVSDGEKTRASYESTIKMLVESNKVNMEMLCTSFQETVSEMKDIISASKKINVESRKEIKKMRTIVDREES